MSDSPFSSAVTPSDDQLDREILELLGKSRPRRRRNWLLWFATLPLRVLVLAILPFWTLIRGSVLAYHRWELNGWLALGFGLVATALVLTAYGAVVSKKLTGRVRIRAVGIRIVAPVVGAFCLYSLIYLSSNNARSDEVRNYYRSVHPLLRVAASTIILVDEQVMITGLGRTREDYANMGLTPRETSLHYEQDDGFVHAMDLRTIGRGETRNRLTEFYFKMMGFSTLRHIGTADHLHVSLPVRGS